VTAPLHCRDPLATDGCRLAQAKVDIVESLWTRMSIDGKPHEHSFVRGTARADLDAGV
jgi:hypothetical protein